MRITAMETFFVKPRWCFLKISTDEGIVGWGEPIVEGRARTVAMAIEELKPLLIGQDPRKISHLWYQMYNTTFYRGGPVLVSAISGIDQALWDIKGKWLGVPVYELLGGACRHKIRMYSHCGGETPQALAQNAKQRQEKGFDAIKIGVPGAVKSLDYKSVLDDLEQRYALTREAVGPRMDIAIDFHGKVSPAMSIRMIEVIKPYYPMFVEEPVLPENVDELVRVARSTTVPIATGERLFTRFGFREVLEKQAAVVLQPDTCHAGGISELMKIGAMAETYYSTIAPHNPLGPISLAACLQVDAASPNFLIQEHPSLANGWDRGEGYLKEAFEIKNGYVDLPTKPGLGIEVDEDVIRERSYPGDWDTPRSFHEDGSVALW